MDAISLTNTSAVIPVAASANITEATPLPVQTDTVMGSSILATTAFSQNTERFTSLASTVLDTSGKYSDDERLQAFSSLFEMAVKGQLRGMDADNAKIYHNAIMDSDIGTKARHIHERGMATVVAADASGQSAAAAQLKFFAGLSDADQKLHFTVNANGFNMSGNRQYASLDSYRDQLVANADYDAKMRNDPDVIAQDLKSVVSATTGDAWSAVILSLFEQIKLNASGSKTGNAMNQVSDASKLPPSYQPGNIRELLA